MLDFGLAVGALSAADHELGWGGESLVSGVLTQTGTIMGTPGYMAPEQFRAERQDRRTDVFAFAVALYEALSGEAPFSGETFASRQAAVLRGVIREPRRALPLWIMRALRRGLAADPEDRYPTLEAMLSDLEEDPDERRRRRLRMVGIVLTAVVTVVTLVFVGEWLWESWRDGRDEANAARRLALAEERIEALLEDGARDEADELFAAFVEHPDNRGRAAVGVAWLGAARRSNDAGDRAAAKDAYATGYAAALRPREQAAALRGLGRIFRAEYRWAALLLATEGLARIEGDDGGREADDLRLDAALANRDLRGAVDLLQGPLADSPRTELVAVLAALTPAMSTTHQYRGSAEVADVDGDDVPELILEGDITKRQPARALRAAPGLPEMAAVDLGWGQFRALDPGPGRAALFVTSELWGEGGTELRDVVLRRWDGDGIAEIFRWPDGQVKSALAEDLDGDGVRELLVGTGPYSRHLLGLRPLADGAWEIERPSPHLDGRGSDIIDLLAEDLDGDGVREVVAALGPWLAYELHLLRFDAKSGELRSAGRHRLGNITGAELLRRRLPASPGSVEIAVAKTDKYRNPSVFPPDRPLGEASGTYVLRLGEGDELIQTAFVPAPSLDEDATVTDQRPLVGDLDGDGRDELVIGRSVADERGAPERDATLIFVSDDVGGLHPAVIGGALPIAVFDVDGDGDDELVLSLAEGHSARPVWVLGAGDERPPPLGTGIVAARPIPTDDPVVAQMCERAEELVQMGLLRQAAESLATAAELVAAPAGRSSALMRVGEIYTLLGRDREAARAYGKAATTARVAAEANAAAARSFLRVGEIEEATAGLRLADAEGVGVVDPALREALRNLREGPSVDVDFGAPLAGWWRIDQPLALRRDAARQALAIDGLLEGDLLSAPIEWAGGALSLELVLDIDQIEWAGGLQIGLLGEGMGADDAEGPLVIDLYSGGGGGRHYYDLRCVSYGLNSSVFRHFPAEERAEQGGRFRIRAQLLPEIGEWTCSIDEDNGALHRHDRGSLVLSGQEEQPELRLRVNAHGDGDSLAAVKLRGVRLRGAGLGPSPEETTSASRMLVDGDVLGALEAIRAGSPQGEDERLVEFAALASLGRWPEATAALRSLIDPREGPSPSVERALRVLLRRDPALYGAILRDAAGTRALREHLYAAWSQPLEMGSGDPRMLPALWAGFAELELGVSAAPSYLRLRAEVAERLGYVDAARSSYHAALAAIDHVRVAPVAGSGAGEVRVSELRFSLALLELGDGDEDAARRALAPVFDTIEPDPGLVDRLFAREDLEPLWDLVEPR